MEDRAWGGRRGGELRVRGGCTRPVEGARKRFSASGLEKRALWGWIGFLPEACPPAGGATMHHLPNSLPSKLLPSRLGRQTRRVSAARQQHRNSARNTPSREYARSAALCLRTRRPSQQQDLLSRLTDVGAAVTMGALEAHPAGPASSPQLSRAYYCSGLSVRRSSASWPLQPYA